LLLLLQLSEDLKKAASTFSPDVKTMFADSAPSAGKCEVLMSCYMSSENDVTVHLNRARGLPANKNIYLKTKYSPDPQKISKINTLVKSSNDSPEYDVHRMVSEEYFIL